MFHARHCEGNWTIDLGWKITWLEVHKNKSFLHIRRLSLLLFQHRITLLTWIDPTKKYVVWKGERRLFGAG
jgi:hypothetical protein